MKSPNQHLFSQVPKADIQRSTFDRSHAGKTTFDADNLIPIFLDEVLPGDTFNLRMNAFARLATPLKPIMDNLYLETFFFFVPNRLVWSNWEKFNGAQDNPGDSTDYIIPVAQVAAANTGPQTIWDYFGLPINEDLEVNALPYRGYRLIYDEWFRDQNLINSIAASDGNGPDVVAGGLQKRGKRHDYFTSALPWPQKGDSVELPLGTQAPVVPDGASAAPTFTDGATYTSGSLHIYYPGGGTPNLGVGTPVPATGTSNAYWEDPGLYADLSTATAATINQIRQAFQIQKLLERDARGGTRYIEIIKAHFGVTSPDARLQRPEYLGGGSARINVTPVPQTSESGTTSQGNLAAFGTASFNGHGFSHSFVEHGYVIGLVNVRSDLTYQQRLDKIWTRSTRYDFYWPALAHLGEQAILSKEIYYNNTASDEDVFGYQERYAEYRYKPSNITGLFRSAAAASLDVWHLSQEFSTRPVLNSTFINSNTPLDRCIAVPSEPHFLMDMYFDYKCARPMPVYGVPGFLDHF